MDPSFISNMPKVELHVHIEGTIEPGMVRNLAKRNNVPIPSSIQEHSEGWSFQDLTSFLSIYYPNMAVLVTSQDFYDLCWAYLLKCRKQNIIHTEIFFDPQAHTQRGVSFETVVQGLHDATVKAEAELKVSAKLIMCFSRDKTPESAMETLEQAKPFKEWIVGVGLDSDERDNPPNKFKSVFQQARAQGYKLTCHCDVDDKDSIEHIRQAIEELQVDRIDHGENAVEDERLIEALKERGIGLTCCPVSNSFVAKDFKGEDILSLLRKGVLVTINSDDPAYFGAYLNQNIANLAGQCYMWKSEVTRMQRNAVKIAWISEDQRDRMLGTVQQWAFSMDNCG